jgi:hypothetical protein
MLWISRFQYWELGNCVVGMFTVAETHTEMNWLELGSRGDSSFSRGECVRLFSYVLS